MASAEGEQIDCVKIPRLMRSEDYLLDVVYGYCMLNYGFDTILMGLGRKHVFQTKKIMRSSNQDRYVLFLTPCSCYKRLLQYTFSRRRSRDCVVAKWTNDHRGLIFSQEVMHQFNTPVPPLALKVNPSIAPKYQPSQISTSDYIIPMTMTYLPTQYPTVMPKLLVILYHLFAPLVWLSHVKRPILMGLRFPVLISWNQRKAKSASWMWITGTTLSTMQVRRS